MTLPKITKSQVRKEIAKKLGCQPNQVAWSEGSGLDIAGFYPVPTSTQKGKGYQYFNGRIVKCC